jgi:glycosyltransferase involved in cell wall biosynthesis
MSGQFNEEVPLPTRALFILKNSHDYSRHHHHHYSHRASGLKNSAIFVSDMLNDNGIPSKVVVVTDNNDIDREVARFKPTHVFVEALWVVPVKFDELKRLHPGVKWVVRIHSQIPFLAEEGVAVDWIREYIVRGVTVAPNSEEAVRDLLVVPGTFPGVIYLPNYYPVDGFREPKCFTGPNLNVGCLGAIRPFKNHLMQAIAAIGYADRHNLTLNFFVNTREEGGHWILGNLRTLFAPGPHKLKGMPWLEHAEFLAFLRDTIDLSMSVSFTETFSIVAADATASGVPIVASDQVPWASNNTHASPTNEDSIHRAIHRVLHAPHVTEANQLGLAGYSAVARKIWVEYLGQ